MRRAARTNSLTQYLIKDTLNTVGGGYYSYLGVSIYGVSLAAHHAKLISGMSNLFASAAYSVDVVADL